ncbi:hypothetical protein HMN09_00682700 [Mycena chlorophos]|uniref:DUF7330 domain-containing protein n=1 Tax=Mycena chlorophos TaxID=658473 RepID=A0A8H6SZU2_MYCCL|nr:hypothetical protein HMN09_00682700 [Mycena chlorophos]
MILPPEDGSKKEKRITQPPPYHAGLSGLPARTTYNKSDFSLVAGGGSTGKKDLPALPPKENSVHVPPSPEYESDSDSEAETVPADSELQPETEPAAAPASGDRIRIHKRWANISGTYFVSPHTPEPEPEPEPGVDKKKKKPKPKPKKHDEPDAFFHSRRGFLSLDIGTAGCGSGRASETAKTSIAASTKSGDININLIAPLVVRPRFDVEITTQSGKLTLFLPQTFSGAIQVYTKTGTVTLLPALTTSMRVVKSTPTESLILVGPQPMGADAQQRPADYCLLRTVSGDVLMGVRGRDDAGEAAKR